MSEFSVHHAGESGVLAAPASIGHPLCECWGDAGGQNETEEDVVGLAGAGSRRVCWALS